MRVQRADRSSPLFYVRVRTHHKCIVAWRPAIPVVLETALDDVQCAQFQHGAAAGSAGVDLEGWLVGSLVLGRAGTGTGVGVCAVQMYLVFVLG